MKIIDGHIHFRPEYENFSEVAASSGHINSEKHLKEVFEKNNICHAIVMGNLDLELENHIYPEYMSYCVGLDSNTFNERPLKYFV